MKRILVQTTIPGAEDDWHVGRFSLLTNHLASLKDDQDNALYEVVGRNRETNSAGNDEVLSNLDTSTFDELWLFAVDAGDGLSVSDCEGITRFRQRGGGIMATRDHEDLGSSLCTIGGVGRAHYFHTKQPEPDELRHERDDQDNKDISWPNYHSGANGDAQRIDVELPVHPAMRDPESETGTVMYLPAHPHEGAVAAPASEPSARVIATGRSVATGNRFNIAVAFERSAAGGPAIAESTFHHFADYNWDITTGAPAFVSEPAGTQITTNPAPLAAFKDYVRNIATWLQK